MTLAYIYHSGFMLEGVSAILIFDFWRDADNGIVERTLSTTHKRVYFLASHFHQDHFNPEILNLPVPHGEKKVILSRDIYRRRRAGTEGVTAYLRRGESYRDDSSRYMLSVPLIPAYLGLFMLKTKTYSTQAT